MPNTTRPLLKWPGGKRQLAGLIAEEIGVVSGRYYEPFAGGLAVFLQVGARASVIGDVNPELTNCYEQVQTNAVEVAAELNKLENTAESYYRVRAWSPSSSVGRAARLIYLVSLSFNGIYRQNSAGQFNVPYGYKTHFKLPDAARIREFAERLGEVSIRAGDFAVTTCDATEGDVVYFDPPYTLAHSNNGFVKYNAKIFSWEDQTRLCLHAKELSSRGVRVFISNAFHSSVDELYLGFRKRVFRRSSIIAASSAKRTGVQETLYSM